MITGNEPAMPVSKDHDPVPKKDGLTIRQYFAAMAMQGLLSNPALFEIFANSGKDINEAADFYSLAAVDHADSLIAELNKEKL